MKTGQFCERYLLYQFVIQKFGRDWRWFSKRSEKSCKPSKCWPYGNDKLEPSSMRTKIACEVHFLKIGEHHSKIFLSYLPLSFSFSFPSLFSLLQLSSLFSLSFGNPGLLPPIIKTASSLGFNSCFSSICSHSFWGHSHKVQSFLWQKDYHDNIWQDYGD